MTLLQSRRIALAAAITGVAASSPVAAQEFVLAGDAYELVHDVAFESGVLSVLDNDPMLPEGRLIVSVTRSPDHGALVMQPDGTFIYTPDPGYLGEDSFDYVVELRPLQVLTFEDAAALDLNAQIRIDQLNSSDTDDAVVPIIGTASVDIGISGDPLEYVQLMELDVRNKSDVSLDFDYSVLSIDIDVASEELNLTLNAPGEGTAVTPPLGAFSQTGNKLGVAAIVDISGSGILGSLVPSGEEHLETETEIDINGSILNPAGFVNLVLNVDVHNEFFIDGNAVELGISGQVLATGPYLPVGASTEATVALNVISPVAIDDAELPGPFQLKGIFPNPISRRATIEVELDRAADLSVDIFDMLGRKVETLPVGFLGSGRHSLEWEVSDLTRGIYIVRVQAGGQSEARTVVVQ